MNVMNLTKREAASAQVPGIFNMADRREKCILVLIGEGFLKIISRKIPLRASTNILFN